MAGHQRVAESGRQEIESGRLTDASRQTGGVGTPQVKGILRKREGNPGGNGGLRVVNE